MDILSQAFCFQLAIVKAWEGHGDVCSNIGVATRCISHSSMVDKPDWVTAEKYGRIG